MDRHMAEDKGIKEAVGKTQTSGFWFLLIPWRWFAMHCPPQTHTQTHTLLVAPRKDL